MSDLLFRNAQAFHKVGDMLIEQYQLYMSQLQQGQPINASMLVPAVVNCAFASELYLKYLLFVETNQPPPHGHDLLKLYNKLTPASQQQVKSAFITHQTQKWVHFSGPIDTTKPSPIHINLDVGDLNALLMEASTAFVDWRYVHETGFLKGFGIFNLPNSVLDVIFAMQPNLQTKVI